MTLLIPSELIELIALYLPNQQQYQCLLVSKSWHQPCHRSLYKNIHINSRQQLRSLFLQLKTKGSLVRKIYLNKSKNNIVGITREELDQLALLCPYLEILDFDQKIWNYIHHDSPKMITEQFQYIQQLPTLTKNIPLLTKSIIRLDLNGKIVSDLFHHGEIISKVLINTPKLKHLSLDSQQETSHAIYISLNEMESIHELLPDLQTFKMIGSFKFNSSHITQQQVVHPPSLNMQHFTLSKVTLPHQWIYYFAHKYPRLQELDFEIVHDDNTHSYKKQDNNVMKKEEIQNLFSILLKSCPFIRKIELDSFSAKLYLTRSFFDSADNHQLKEIKLKDLPYNVVTREENDKVFDLFMERGKKLITSLTTEVIGSDQHISSLLGPISALTQLTELVIHCGHPYYDCELDLVLKACPNLLNLTIRSAHVTVTNGAVTTDILNHPLKSLSLSNTRFSSPIFDYLGKSCSFMDTMKLYECEQEDASILNIHMPRNKFKTVTMNGIRLNSVSLDNSNNARFLSIQTESTERWYYAINRKPCHPNIQRLNHRKSLVTQTYYNNKGGDAWINHHKNQQDWMKNLMFGMISIQCQSIQQWELIYHTNYIEF